MTVAGRFTLASLIVIITCLIAILINQLGINVAELTEKEKCPACYGVSMCQNIHEITLDFLNFHSIFNHIFGVKNVYYGNYRNEKVVMKKLASNAELAVFDETTVHTFAGKNKVDFNELIMSELIEYSISNKIHLCPTIEKINDLLQNIENPDNNVDHLKYLWTTLKINPEPIMLQILNANDNWPTPKYFGACGRLIIEEFIGPPLSAFTMEPWIKRARIASSLLDAAYLFTFKNEKFAFYLTDISMDNIAVNREEKAIFIDLENIIIVDKSSSTKLDSWNDIYTHDIESDCQDCFTFSTSDICEHKISDLNYYAICQHILMQDTSVGDKVHGFLHNPPEYVLKNYPTLKQLLKRCSSNKQYSRIDGGIKLKQLLDVIIKNDEIIH